MNYGIVQTVTLKKSDLQPTVVVLHCHGYCHTSYHIPTEFQLLSFSSELQFLRTLRKFDCILKLLYQSIYNQTSLFMCLSHHDSAN